MNRTLLAPADWQARRDAHVARVRRWTDPLRERRARDERHPVLDFLFTYYSHRPARLLRWHPGPGVELAGAREYLRWPAYRATEHGVTLGPLPAQRRPTVEFVHGLLTATAAREPRFGCFGLHEWAMVYRRRGCAARELAAAAGRRRHRRGGRVASGAVHALRRVPVLHRAGRAPLNSVQPQRSDQVALEQPGCLHAGMDLYKWAYKLDPFAPSELVADCFALALDIRSLDMRASPYDLRAARLRSGADRDGARTC